MGDNCYFQPCLSSKPLINARSDRIRTIIAASKARQDSKAEDLTARLEGDEQLVIKCHKDCVSSYTSKNNIQRILKRTGSQHKEASPVKLIRRSQIPTFQFREHCLFCGELCTVERDPKNPRRWRPAFLCRTIERGVQTFKESILDICNTRQDDISLNVKMRLMGAVSDLHAADGRYHDDCRKSFMSARSVASASRAHPRYEGDPAVIATVDTMMLDKSRIWNSCEIFDIYIENGGTALSRRTLVCKLCELIGADLLVLSGNGVASLVLFRSKASAMLHLLTSDTDEEELVLDRIAKNINLESRQISIPNNEYRTRMNMDIALQSVSPTLLALLKKISSKLDNTAASALIGNIVTNVVSNQPTSLQIDLSVLLNRKTLIEDLYKYRVCCSYDEYRRFRASAAKAAENQTNLRGIVNADEGLVQVVADNFDSNVSSQNGLLATHSLAVLLTVRDQEEETESETTIRRLSREELRRPITHDVPVQRYQGSKKPPMPEREATQDVLPLRVLAQQVIQLARTRDLDFNFLKHIVTDKDTPEFAGYNTKLCREQGQASQPATRAIYTPLIDMDPADPDTMLTAMVEAKRLTNQCRQDVTVFTNDQQLYKVAVHITWVYPDLFADFIPRLGGMHTLMSFIGSVGNLMAESGLEEIMKSAFGSVPKMLAGKMFPQNFRALRIVVEEILRPIIVQVNTMDELIMVLESKAADSPTSKLWYENLVKPVLIMMAFVRAEREGKWTLHLWAVQQMLPYFFAAGHHNYARYGVYYLRTMKRLHGNVLEKFLKGEHVMRHKKGLWNGIWSDMFIETTFMRYGKGPRGIIGVTMKPETLKKWAFSMHICSRILQDLTDMTDDNRTGEVSTHKEEGPSRIHTDAQDRLKVKQKLEACIDPFDTRDDTQSLMNIVTGRIASDNVNVHNAIEIGQKQITKYTATWPTGFYSTIPKEVITMAVARKSIRVGTTDVCDATLIYSRVLGLQPTRDINFQQVLKYELAPIPTAMFDDKGEMRISKTKSGLMKQLKVESSARNSPAPDATVIDGSAILWVVHWPAQGTVQDYVNNVCNYILQKARFCDIYVVFDRYHDYSIKSGTRLVRAGQMASRRHKLSLTAPLPLQKVALTVTENKAQLTELICQQLVSVSKYRTLEHKLVITGKDPTPVETLNGLERDRVDLQTTHEEADVIIVQQVVRIANEGATSIKVTCDDTDVFVLLVYFYYTLGLSCILVMESSSGSERKLIDIGASAEKHKKIVVNLPGAHALTGCDTVPHASAS